MIYNEPLYLEIITTLRSEGDYNSPRIRNLINAIEYLDGTPEEMLKAFINHYIELDEDVTKLSKELIDCKAHSYYIPIYKND